MNILGRLDFNSVQCPRNSFAVPRHLNLFLLNNNNNTLYLFYIFDVIFVCVDFAVNRVCLLCF